MCKNCNGRTLCKSCFSWFQLLTRSVEAMSWLQLSLFGDRFSFSQDLWRECRGLSRSCWVIRSLRCDATPNGRRLVRVREAVTSGIAGSWCVSTHGVQARGVWTRISASGEVRCEFLKNLLAREEPRKGPPARPCECDWDLLISLHFAHLPSSLDPCGGSLVLA